MSDNVTIPQDVAKAYAAAIRDTQRTATAWPADLNPMDLADLLDPKPPTLADKVCERLETWSRSHCSPAYAQSILDFVADEIEQTRLVVAHDYCLSQQEAIVSRLRGQS